MCCSSRSALRRPGRLIGSLADLNESLRGRILEAAEGNPLYVEEMVALVVASGGGEVVVPPTIQALLAARLDQLDASERGVLERGAVVPAARHAGFRLLLRERGRGKTARRRTGYRASLGAVLTENNARPVLRL